MIQEPSDNLESSDSSRWVIRPADDVRIEHGVEAAEELGIDELPEALGYVEGPKLQALRSSWVEAIAARSEKTREFATAYQEEAEAAHADYLARFRYGCELVCEWMLSNSEREDWILEKAGALGFSETADMRALRARIAISQAQQTQGETAADVTEKIAEYREMARDFEAKVGAKFQIGLLIAKATIQRDGREVDYYREDLGDVLDYAIGMGFADVVVAIDQELNPPQA